MELGNLVYPTDRDLEILNNILGVILDIPPGFSVPERVGFNPKLSLCAISGLSAVFAHNMLSPMQDMNIGVYMQVISAHEELYFRSNTVLTHENLQRLGNHHKYEHYFIPGGVRIYGHGVYSVRVRMQRCCLDNIGDFTGVSDAKVINVTINNGISSELRANRVLRR